MVAFLVGDIGGTKTHLAAMDEKDLRKKLYEKKYVSKEYPDLLSIIQDFLLTYSAEKNALKGACFGVAGPVQEGRCKATNLPWTIDAQEIAQALSLPSIGLINDLEAHAWGIPLLKEEEIFVLQKGIAKKGNKALLAAGTGLGEAGLFWNGEKHIPFATEGGHADFAPRDELEMELLRYLIEQHPHVSCERVVSGPGLYQLYRFLVDMRLEEEDPEVRKAFSVSDPPRVITQLALEEKDDAAMRAVEWFISLYGAEAGNVALKFLTYEGIYLSGGIAPQLLSLLQKGEFLEAFAKKGRFGAAAHISL
jgi:glucokinase